MGLVSEYRQKKTKIVVGVSSLTGKIQVLQDAEATLSLGRTIGNKIKGWTNSYVLANSNKYKDKALSALKSLSPLDIGSDYQRDYLGLIEWSSNHLWDASLEGLTGTFKSYCPIKELSLDTTSISTASLNVGGFNFSYISGVPVKTCTARFYDDSNYSLLISLKEWMSNLADITSGVIPLKQCGRTLTLQGLDRQKKLTLEIEMVVVPKSAIQMDNNQSPEARLISVSFDILASEFRATS